MRYYRGKRQLRALIAKLMVFAMIVTSTFIATPNSYAKAATKAKTPAITKESADILIGSTYDLSIKNQVKGSTYHWKASNTSIATVDKEGIVKGLSKGKTVITCTVKAEKKVYKLKCNVTVIKPATSVSIKKKVSKLNAGQKVTLGSTVKPSSSNDKVTWSTSDSKIATVNSKGKVTAVTGGAVTITAKTISGKSDKVSIQVVDKEGTVSTQEELEALLGSGVSVITIKTDEELKFTIPTGDYSNQTLIVDAPKADVVNNGEFKEIQIKQIKSDTWYEQAVGNVVNVTAPTARVIVSENANATIEVNSNNTTLKLVNNGTVNELVLNGSATVNVSGTSSETMKVTANVPNATVTASVPLDLTCNEKINLTILPGAETTVIHVDSEANIPVITGNTSITVIVGTGDNAVTRVVEPTNSLSTSTSGSSGSSGTPSTPTTPIQLGTISGTVTVASGSAISAVTPSALTVSGSALIANANVRVLKYVGDINSAITSIFTNPNTVIATTDENGEYSVSGLTPGNYVVVISKDGYRVLVQLTTVANNSNTIINASLIELNDGSVSNGIATGSLINALDGELVDSSLDFTIKVYSNFNSTNDLILTKTVTNAEYTLDLPEGYYTVQVIDNREAAYGVTYATTTTNLVVLGGTTFSNQNIILSTAKELGQATFVLTWGEYPSDLDSHLIGPVEGDANYHIYYANLTYPEYTDNIEELDLRLDLDDVTSYGPETTSIYNPVEGAIYYFYVYNFSGNEVGTLVNSSAKVVITTSTGTYTFEVPSGGDERSWLVCSYNSATGEITPINQLVSGNYIDTYLEQVDNFN